MYFIIIVLGFVCVALIISLLNTESKERQNIARAAFNWTGIGVYNGPTKVGHEMKSYYPIRSVQHLCGRKEKLSKSKVDITSANPDDNEIEQKAVLFFVENGDFCLRRLDQPVVWITDERRENVYVLKDSETTVSEIPKGLRSKNNPDSKFNELENDVIVLNMGDNILIGQTLFEYNSKEKIYGKIRKE